MDKLLFEPYSLTCILFSSLLVAGSPSPELPCADDVQLGLSEGLGQPTNDWSQYAGEDATLPSSEPTPPSPIK